MYSLLDYGMVLTNTQINDSYYNERQQNTMNYLGTLSPAASSVDSSDVKMNSPMSSSNSTYSMMSPTNMYSSNIMLLDDVNGEAYMEVIEQPVEKFRFRYKSEMVGTHGSLTGVNSDRVRKSTYPTVHLHNFDQPAIIRCSLYQFKLDEPHAHRLIIKAGSGEKDDPHDMEVSTLRGYTAVFQGMGIIHTAKKHLLPELEKKKLRLLREHFARNNIFRKFTPYEEAEIKNQADNQSKNINLNTVRLKFEAFRIDSNGVLLPICNPVYSHGINNLKSALTGELKIVRMDYTTTSCVGGQEIFILVEKVTKNNIKVRFFEQDEDGNEIWSDFGKFSHMDVHHQYAIVFKAPPYKDQNIENTVEVCIELFRPSDGARSEPRQFRYKPSERTGRKRPRCSESLSSGELPATINNFSFNSSISLPDSLLILDPDFLKNPENVNSAEFEDLFKGVHSSYQCLTVDGPSICESSFLKPKRDSDTEAKAKKVVSNLSILLKQNPPPEMVERGVKKLFSESLTSEGNNALHTSILCEQYHHLQYILVLLTKMKHLKITDIQNNVRETALHIAMKVNNPTVVELLLPVGADPNLIDNNGNTPLHLGIINGNNLNDYKTLIRNTKLETENYDGHTPLHLAVQKNDITSLTVLAESAANINHRHRSNGHTVLHMAIEEKYLDVVEFLLEKTNARLDIENFTKITPVHMAKLIANSEEENDISKKIYKLITGYVREKGFEELMIKTELEEDYDSDDSEIVVKSEPDYEMEIVDDPIVSLKKMDFSEDCIRSLSLVLDKSKALQRLTKDIGFDSMAMSNVKTSMVLQYANVTGISVYEIRKFLELYGCSIAVDIIDDFYLSSKN